MSIKSGLEKIVKGAKSLKRNAGIYALAVGAFLPSAALASDSIMDLELRAGVSYKLDTNQMVLDAKGSLPLIASDDGSYVTDQIVYDLECTIPLDEGAEPVGDGTASIMYNRDLGALTDWGPFVKGSVGINYGNLGTEEKINGVFGIDLTMPFSEELFAKSSFIATWDSPERPAVILEQNISWNNGDWEARGEGSICYPGEILNELPMSYGVSVGHRINNNTWVTAGYSNEDVLNSDSNMYENESSANVGVWFYDIFQTNQDN